MNPEINPEINQDMNDILLVLTNLPDEASAAKLARQLVETHAAACVSRLAPCISTYRWQNSIEIATEIPLLIKTSREPTRFLKNCCAKRTLTNYPKSSLSL